MSTGSGKGVFLTIEVDDKGTGVVRNFEAQYKKALEAISNTKNVSSGIADAKEKLDKLLASTNSLIATHGLSDYEKKVYGVKTAYEQLWQTAKQYATDGDTRLEVNRLINQAKHIELVRIQDEQRAKALAEEAAAAENLRTAEERRLNEQLSKQKELTNLMAAPRTVIATKGMNASEREIYAINARYQEMNSQLQKLGVTGKEAAAAQKELNSARHAEIINAKNRAYAEQQGRLNSIVGSLGGIASAMGLAFGAYQLADIIKDTALLAARYETLGVVSDVVARNIGMTKQEMDALTQSVQKQGISLMASRDSVIRMGQAHMDMSKAAQLARIAQDAAVIGGMNSSEALQRMTYGIQSAQIEVLRTIGLNVNFESSYARLAKQIGKKTDALTEEEKIQARTNEVMRASTSIAGSYEAAMDTAGKKMTSLTRYTENLQVVLGQTFNDALIIGVDKLTGGLLSANSAAKELAANHQLEEWGEDLVYVFAFVADSLKATIGDAKILYSLIPGTGITLKQALKDKGEEFNPDNTFSGQAEKYFKEKAQKAAGALRDEWGKQFDKNPLSMPFGMGSFLTKDDIKLLAQGDAGYQRLYAATGQAADGVKKTGEEQKKLNRELDRLRETIATAGMTDYEKQLYKINEEYKSTIGGLEGMATAQNKALAARARDIELIAAQREQLGKLNDLMQGVQEDIDTAGLDEWGKKFYQLSKDQGELVKKIQEESAGLVKTKALTQGQVDEMLGKAEQSYQDKYGALVKEQQQEQVEEQEKLLKEQEDASRETYENMAGFFRDALVQMDGDAGSFVESIIKKLKNLAASVAANALSSLMPQAGGGLASMIGIGGGGTGGGLLGMVGAGGGSGGGFNLMSLLSGGKTAYSAFNNGSISSLFGGGQLGMNTALPASVGGGPLPLGAESMSWLGAGAGALGLGFGGYGMYNAYKSGSYGMGALSGAGAGLGAVTLAASGALGSTMAGAAAGSVVPVVGTIIGAAVGAAVAAFGAGAAADAREEARLAANYYRGVGRAANADISNMTLAEYTKGGSGWLSGDAVDAATKLGGFDSATADEMQRVLDIATDYQDAVQGFGGSSAQAVGQFQRVSVELEALKGKAAGATGASRDLLLQFQAIAEKTKALQIKQLTTDLQEGVGLFTDTLDKLESVGMDQEELDKLVASEGIKFLTTDTMPALTGELTKVREAYKEAQAAVDDYNESQEDQKVKQQILLSDMELTEQQLQGIKYGKVNSELIALAQALGETDKQLTLVSADAEAQASIFDSLKNAAESLQGGIDSMAAMYQNVDPDSIPESLMKTYAELQKITSALTIVATAGQKLEELPQSFEDLKTAIDDCDLAGVNSEILEISDSALYLSAALDQIGLDDVANIAAGFGEVGSAVYGVIEIVLLLERTIENAMQQFTRNDEAYDWVEGFIEKIEKAFPKIGEKLRETWLYSAEDLKASIEEALNGTKSFEAALGSLAGYKEAIDNKGLSDYEIQKRNIVEQAEKNAAALQKEYNSYYEKSLEDGSISEAEQEYLDYLLQAMGIVKDGSAEMLAELEKQRLEAIADFNQGLDDTINTADMSGLEKSFYDLNSWYEAQQKQMDKLSMTTEEYAAALAKLDEAERAQAKAIIKSAVASYQDAIDNKGLSDYEIQKRNIVKQAEETAAALQAEYSSYYTKALEDGSISAAEQEYLNYLLKAMGIVKDGSAEMLAELEKQLKEQRVAFNNNLDTIILSSGMSDFEKSLLNLSSWYDQQKDALDELGLETADYNAALDKLDTAFSVQALDAINNYFDAITESISDFSDSLTLSKYNVFASPAELAKNYQTLYQQALEEFNTAEPGEMGSEWGDLQSAAQDYLDYMYSTYGPAQAYQDAYAQVMQMLAQAGATVEGAEDIYASKYESDSIQHMTAVADNTKSTVDELKSLRGEVAALQKAIAALNATVAATPAQTGKAVADNLPAAKR